MYSPEPEWYKEAVIYELHVRAFSDSDEDGEGDFAGLNQKLPYLQDLGVTAIWLLPFYPSPLRDDGYDIADYTGINPSYGALEAFREFVDSAHARGIQVITELVLNHTSDQHPWFLRARRAAPGSSLRNFYVWNDTPEKYRDARIIFKDFEHSNWTYDHVARQYYWHRFYSHQPDLNYDNPDVWKAIMPVVDFWLELGVDGLRLDAVPYLYEREGTNCENLPETHAFLKALRKHVDDRFANRMLLAEANQWPEDAVQYLGNGDECHMAFHFPLMPRLFMSIQREDSFPVIDIMEQTPALPDNCQWALFLRNHDELTLEMVTDEERDYMYRAYASESKARINLGIRRRLAPLMGNDRRRIELMNSLLFSLPGAPVIYYGDEIAMGDNIYLGDRNGVRTPMQWSSDRNAGFSRANPQKLFLPIIIDPEYHYESINVEAHQNNPHSLLWWMKRLIATRKRHKALSRGGLEFLHPDNRSILTFLRQHDDETILVVANLSRFVQFVTLDLSRFQGIAPVELFGQTRFPVIAAQPYFLSLGPHAFYWFALSCQPAQAEAGHGRSPQQIPQFRGDDNWEALVLRDVPRLAACLPGYFASRRPTTGEESVRHATFRDTVPLAHGDTSVLLSNVRFETRTGAQHATSLPLALAGEAQAHTLLETTPELVLARFNPGVIYDASTQPDFVAAILDGFRENKWIRTQAGGALIFHKLPGFDQAAPSPAEPLTLSPDKNDSFNTTVLVNNQLIWKMFFQVEDGPHPEVELGQFLAENGRFVHTRPRAGVLEYRMKRGSSMVLGVLHALVPFAVDAWQRVLHELSGFFDRVLAKKAETPAEFPLLARAHLWMGRAPTEEVLQHLEGFLEEAELMGRRSAEFHVALASAPEIPEFAPEPITNAFQRSMYQTFRNRKLDVLDLVRRNLASLPNDTQTLAQLLLSRANDLNKYIRPMIETRVLGVRMRVHGDLTLSQMLHRGKDYLIRDFEGPVRTPLSERRIKRSPLVDVVSMLRSFDLAARIGFQGLDSERGRVPGSVRPEDVRFLAPWCRCWTGWMGSSYLQAYLHRCRELNFSPASPESLPVMIQALFLDQALEELDSELRFRGNWAGSVLTGLLETLDELEGESPPAASRLEESTANAR